MKPKNNFQKQVFEASKKLPSITQTQVEWANRNCFKPVGRRTKKGIITCLQCGVSWKSHQSPADSVCICPNCKKELKLQDTRKSVFNGNEYFCTVTVCSGFQVLRFYYAEVCMKVGLKAKYTINEVVQWWIAPDGKHTVRARLRGINFYSTAWNLRSKLEIRPERQVHRINPTCMYPRYKLISALKRSGYRGDCYGITPFDLFYTLLTDSRAETLLKRGETKVLKYFTGRGLQWINNYWASLKICMRNDYHIEDVFLWRDYIDLLRFFGKDLHNAKYVCPADLKSEHDRYVQKKREWQKQQDAEIARKTALEEENRFIEMKAPFFGIMFTDGLVQVKVIESVEEVMQEGDVLHHCIYANSYHLKPDSLLLSACIGDKRIETVEVSLSTFKVLQSRGVCNSNTEHHDRIIKLVERNKNLIKKRLAA